MVLESSVNSSRVLSKSTAYNRVFFMGVTGLTLTVTISKNGGSFGSPAGAVTEIANGWYKIALTSADTNTLGDLVYHATDGGVNVEDWSDQVSIIQSQLAPDVIHGTGKARLILSKLDELSGTVTGATNATPIVITSVGHGLPIGPMVGVQIINVTGNTAANGQFIAVASDADHFSLFDAADNPVAGNGAYAGGGTWVTLSLQSPAFQIDGVGVGGYATFEGTLPNQSPGGVSNTLILPPGMGFGLTGVSTGRIDSYAVEILTGTGQRQRRRITYWNTNDNTGGGVLRNRISVDDAWKIQPADGDKFRIDFDRGPSVADKNGRLISMADVQTIQGVFYTNAWVTSPSNQIGNAVTNSVYEEPVLLQDQTALPANQVQLDGVMAPNWDLSNPGCLIGLGSNNPEIAQITAYNTTTKLATLNRNLVNKPVQFSTRAVILAPTGGSGGPVQLAASQPFYAPSTASALASDAAAILAAVGSPMQAGSAVTVGGYSAGQDPATYVSAISIAGKRLDKALAYIGATTTGLLPTGAGTGQENWLDFAGAPAVDITVDQLGNRTAIVYH